METVDTALIPKKPVPITNDPQDGVEFLSEHDVLYHLEETTDQEFQDCITWFQNMVKAYPDIHTKTVTVTQLQRFIQACQNSQIQKQAELKLWNLQNQ